MYICLIIMLTGVVAGFFNTVAGGGSLLTMPVLIFIGLPSAIANGTNRIALFFQNIIAVTNFKRKGYFDWKLSISLAIPAVLGSIIGANIAIALPDMIFKTILAIVMLIVVVVMIWNPQKSINDAKNLSEKKRNIISIGLFFFVGIYGGLIQAGVGIIIIAVLTILTGFPLAKINSIKVFVVGIYILSSLIVFIISGKVNWLYGFCLAIGNGFGAYLGSNFSVAKGDKWIKIILFIVVIYMALNLLGVINLF